VIGLPALLALSALPILAAAPEKQADGVVVPLSGGVLKIEVCADDLLRVAYAPDRAFFARRSLAASVRRCGDAHWRLDRHGAAWSVVTSKLRARIDPTTGAVTFLDAKGRVLLAEARDGRTTTAAQVQGEKTFHVRQRWEANADESLYGLGQNQLGLVDIKGYDLDLWQHNGSVVVPFLVSSRGYGVFWDNTSFTRFGDLREWEPIPAARLYDADGRRGGLTGSYFSGSDFKTIVARRDDRVIDVAVPGETTEPNIRIHPALPPKGDVSVRWEGAVEADATGDHIFQTFSNAGVRLWIDDRLVIDHWRQGWLPWLDVARVRLEAGRRYRLKLEWTEDQYMATMRLTWKTPPARTETSLWSEVGDGIDYYFAYGPSLDQVIAGYRRLTGTAPMMPRWAFGLWQSRQRYKTSAESLEVLDGFRARHIPLDVIVQDWFYWKDGDWGSHRFDAARFPDPTAWVQKVHDQKAKLVLSVWPKFYVGTASFEAMHARGFLYEPNLREGIKDWLGFPDSFYDAFNKDARALFWSQIERELLPKGFDGWWMDASEPDLLPTPTLDGQRSHVHPTALGTGARMLNAYSLVNSQAIYEGQRAADPQRRVMILTRSAFGGQQRYGAATWSGDISSTWAAMRKQIAAGLSFSISGIPYWSMDVGGFSVPPRFAAETPRAEDVEEWRELNTRWFQFGTFVPLLRVHGEAPNREMWSFGGEAHPAYRTQLAMDRTRYRLLSYIYSLAAAATRENATILRPLVMDFPEDRQARTSVDQYLFGPALLVNPVTTYKARQRAVYLPKGTWYDLWSGAVRRGGRTIDAAAPYETIPVFVRAGSILPIGPPREYTAQDVAGPVTCVVYAGADGGFTLYEDDGSTNDYESGAFSVIRFRWDDHARRLTIGAREGTFPGMLSERSFRIILASPSHRVVFPADAEEPRTHEVRYTGREMSIVLK
jgi:alpha-D-xyloside xylohydrolase